MTTTNVIRIKRRSASGEPGAPGSLENAELAYNENDDTLYYGKGTGGAGGTATSVEAIGGQGAFVTKSTNQTISGNKTFSGTIAVPSPTENTHATTKLYVDTAINTAINSYSFTLSGDTGTGQPIQSGDTLFISGGTGLSSLASGTDTLTINLDNTTVGAGNYGSSTEVASFTVDAQGRLTSASNTSIRLASYSNTGLASFSSTDFIVTSGAVSLNSESIQDIIGAMFSGNIESGISVTYDDENAKYNFDVNDPVITINGDVDGFATMTNLGDTTITVTLDTVNSNVGTFGSTTAIPVLTVNGKGLVTGINTVAISTTLTVGADTGTDDAVSLGTDVLDFVGGEGIDTLVSNNTITISGEDASTTNKGVASFNTDNFSVSSGAVSVKSGGISNSNLANTNVTIGTTSIALGSSSVTLAGLQQVDIDNIRIDGNTISATNEDGGISLDPNGTGHISVNSARIENLAEPVAATDAATKGYVDAVSEGLHIHAAVKATTGDTLASLTGGTVTYDNGTNGIGATLTLSVALTVLDDYALQSGDRVLVKNQVNQAHNGIYTWATGGTVLTRATDFDTGAEIAGGDFVFVDHGLNYANTGWVCIDEVVTVGTDAVVFVQFSGAGTFLAGNGLVLDGSTFNINLASNSGLLITSDELQVNSTIAGDGLTFASGVLTVGGTANVISVSADAITISPNYVGQSSITTLGTIGTGTWQGNVVQPTYGGTGVNNGSSTITIGGNFTLSGNHTSTFSLTGNTSVTFPTTGTLATTTNSETISNKTITNSSIGTSNPNTAAFTTLTSNGATTFTANTGSTSITTGTLVVTGGVGISENVFIGSDLVGAGVSISEIRGFLIDGGTF
jgi:hypothetical protein